MLRSSYSLCNWLTPCYCWRRVTSIQIHIYCRASSVWRVRIGLFNTRWVCGKPTTLSCSMLFFSFCFKSTSVLQHQISRGKSVAFARKNHEAALKKITMEKDRRKRGARGIRTSDDMISGFTPAACFTTCTKWGDECWRRSSRQQSADYYDIISAAGRRVIAFDYYHHFFLSKTAFSDCCHGVLSRLPLKVHMHIISYFRRDHFTLARVQAQWNNSVYVVYMCVNYRDSRRWKNDQWRRLSVCHRLCNEPKGKDCVHWPRHRSSVRS